MKKRVPNVCVLKTDGINCDEETAHAFSLAGGRSRIVHVNELRGKTDTLKNYQILVIPGGFCYGDDVASGKILALELESFLSDQIRDFIEKQKGLVLGICNGFQVLIRTGLLPFGRLGEMEATFNDNDSGHLECRWINLKIENVNRCVFLKECKGVVSYQVAHGEGKLFAKKRQLDRIEKEKLVVFRFCDSRGKPTQVYPQNPNGAIHAIAGLTDPTGRILGIMPHPERFVRTSQHPNWRRMNNLKPQGLPIFEHMISYASGM